MLKKTITFKDFNGNERTEDFFFHLSKAELVEMELSMHDGLMNHINSIIKSQDRSEIIAVFKKIVKAAYGRRTADGSGFVKKDEFWDEFVTTEAYSEFFIGLITDAEAAANFIAGCLPNNMQEQLAEQTKQDLKPKKLTDYTEVELRSMPAEDFKILMSSAKGGNIPRSMLRVALSRNDI